MTSGPELIEELLAPLSEIQRDIVTNCDGPMLVLAGAGSGKTRAVTHKIAYLLTKRLIMPYRVLAVTFTNKAAGEMKDRVRKLVGPPADGVELGTFHSVCARLLRRNAELLGYTSSFVIYDPGDGAVLMRHLVNDRGLDKKRYRAKALVSTYDSLRSRNRDIDLWIQAGRGDDAEWRETAARLFAEYERRKRALNAMDFSDLLFQMHRLLAENDGVKEFYQERYQYVLVDEMQDTNYIQMELLKQLVGPHLRICAVGDDDQSIYGWRGARVDNMLNFEAVFEGTRIVRMEQNYRSVGTILDAANSVIRHNQRRHSKRLWTDNVHGEKLQFMVADSEGDEAVKVARLVKELGSAEGIPRRRMAVFYRTNAQSRSFEEVFAQQEIPHVVVGGLRFYERAEVKDILAFLRVVQNPRDEVSLLRIVNKPTRGIGNTGLDRLRRLASHKECSLYEACLALAEQEEPERWARPITAFVKMVEKWRREADGVSVPELARQVLDESGYLERLRAQDDVEAESRLENLDQLLASMAEFDLKQERPALSEYLEQVSLITDLDLWREDRDYIPLMTVHSAKGLEFDVVFITGMEEGLFPHENHMNAAELEEERRLFYVALTRARKRVYISRTRSRARFGEWKRMKRSMFLKEIPPGLVAEMPVRRRGSFQDALRARVHRRKRKASAGTEGKGGTQVRVREAAGASPEWAGETVKHRKHGKGKVIAVIGKGGSAQVVVKFESGDLVTVSGYSIELLP